MNTFDFEYKQDNKEPIIVEVDYYYEEPNPFSRESDWDYYGGLIVDGIRFYSGTKELFDIDISPSEIVYQFKKHMEDFGNAIYYGDKQIILVGESCVLCCK